jgi:hypothetical protein
LVAVILNESRLPLYGLFGEYFDAEVYCSQPDPYVA